MQLLFNCNGFIFVLLSTEDSMESKFILDCYLLKIARTQLSILFLSSFVFKELVPTQHCGMPPTFIIVATLFFVDQAN